MGLLQLRKCFQGKEQSKCREASSFSTQKQDAVEGEWHQITYIIIAVDLTRLVHYLKEFI